MFGLINIGADFNKVRLFSYKEYTKHIRGAVNVYIHILS